MHFKMVILAEDAIPLHLAQEWSRQLTDSLTECDFVVAASATEAMQKLPDADAALGTLSPEMLALSKNLRWVNAPAAAPPAGYYHPALVDHQCTVTNFRGIYNDHIAAQILGLILSFVKNLHLYRDLQKSHTWQPLGADKHALFLPEATVLIVGVGGIGYETARLCKAFNTKVLGVDARRQQGEWIDKWYPPNELDVALPLADFIVVTVPHTPSTEGMFNRERFALMKESAIFINIGRGKTTSLDALQKALITGCLGGAALDVFEEEPLPINSPLWSMDNVIITPHIAAHGGQNINERRFGLIIDNVRRFIAGEKLRNIVNKREWF